MSTLPTLQRRAVQRVLNGALAVEARSALAYGLQISAGVEDAVAADIRQSLVELRSQLGKAASELANRILELGGTPDPGNYPLVATNYNFLNVLPLLERLEPSLPGDIARLEALADALSEPADVRELLRGLITQKRAQHAALQALLAKLRPAPPAPPTPAPAADA